MDATAGDWHSLSDSGSVLSVPSLQPAGFSRSQANASWFQLAGSEAHSKTPRRLPRVFVSFGDKSGSGKEGAAAVLEEEGKDEDGDAAPPPDTNQKDEMGPELHGRTVNNDSCRCMSNVLEPPRASWLFRKAASGITANETTRRSIYHQRLDDVDMGTKDQLKAYYEAGKWRDYAFSDLHDQHTRTEKLSKDISEAFRELKDAYSEGDCTRVVSDAEANEEPVPECHKHFEQAVKEMREIRGLIAPRCKSGAISLRAMQPPKPKNPPFVENGGESADEVKQGSMPLPLELLLAIPSLARQHVARKRLHCVHLHNFL
jgi:hypothetical protein